MINQGTQGRNYWMSVRAKPLASVAFIDTFYWGGQGGGQCLIRGAHKKTETNDI